MTSFPRFNSNSRTGSWGQIPGSNASALKATFNQAHASTAAAAANAKTLDLSEFPSLGVARSDAFPPLSAGLPSQPPTRSEQFKSIVTSNLAAQAAAGAHHSQVTPSMNPEDFPALPGTSPSMANRLASLGTAGHSGSSSSGVGGDNSSSTHHHLSNDVQNGVGSLTSSLSSMAISGATPSVPLSSLVANPQSPTGLAGGPLSSPGVSGGPGPGNNGTTNAGPYQRPPGETPRKPTISFNELKGGPPDNGLSSPLAPSGGSTGAAVAAAAAAAAASVSNVGASDPMDHPRAAAVVSPVGSPADAAGRASLENQYGLLGLLDTLKTSNPDKSALAFGYDVSKFGLNLSSPGLLYATFTTPWIDQSQANLSHIKPEFTLPACYQVRPRRPAVERMDHFLDETLFYIFYTMPRDELQETAALELYKRNWRYHKDLKLWLTKDPEANGGNGGTMPIGSNSAKGGGGEHGVYIFFDPSTWQKVYKEFVLMYDVLEDRHAFLGGAAGSGPNPTPSGGGGSSNPNLSMAAGLSHGIQGGVGGPNRTGLVGPLPPHLSGNSLQQQQQQQQHQQQDLANLGGGGLSSAGPMGMDALNGSNSAALHRTLLNSVTASGGGLSNAHSALLAQQQQQHHHQHAHSLSGLTSQHNFLAQLQQLQHQSMGGGGGGYDNNPMAHGGNPAGLHHSLLNSHSLHLSQQQQQSGGMGSGGSNHHLQSTGVSNALAYSSASAAAAMSILTGGGGGLNTSMAGGSGGVSNSLLNSSGMGANSAAALFGGGNGAGGLGSSSSGGGGGSASSFSHLMGPGL